MASKSGTTDSPTDPVSKDGFYRAFRAACNKGLKDKNRGPTVAQYLGALMTRPRYSEKKLPKSWQAFATAEPEIASMLRRSAAEFRVSVHGKLVKLGDKKKSTAKFLIVSNPDYVMGTATFPDLSGDPAISEKAEKDKAKKSKGKEKVVRINDEDDNGNYDSDDSDQPLAIKRKISAA
ncbi:unnamed protein product [Clonostachys byssicola]|uniref:Uncharacterized protein n=1 Tax=Clonostachys byssicola TaxID=160290 RepID=A0A9N9YA23_9HYPO|nr:unnamed protein product [Clonostachys byssicola]